MALFLLSLGFTLVSLFASRWSSAGPTLLPAHVVNPQGLRDIPAFLQVPADGIYLPLTVALVLGVALRFIPPSNTARLLIKPLLILLGLRYFVWRSLTTLNFSHPMSTTFSLVVYGAEAICFGSLLLHTLQTIFSTERQRKRQADSGLAAIAAGTYLPSVDVFVPTYNEPDYIVRRTVMGCQAMDYPNKTIYILDDTRRPHIRALAAELGCEYITRPDNAHAKAGNLNHALQHTQGELIALMDADFVPFHHFLQRTVGFFQDAAIKLVQTPQNFYNPDYHARNLGLEHFLPNDLEHFYGFLQTNRDVANAVICCGSCYVVRRDSLEAVGGYYTRCCVEDFQTSLKMLLKGDRIIYLNETLSMGESTRTYADFIDQRLRWLQGNLQVYFCDDLPIWQKLSLAQKSFLFSQLIYCLAPVFRLVFLLAPLIGLFSGINPYLTTIPELIYYFLPFWFFAIFLHAWSCDYRSSQLWADVYEVIFCFPSLGRLWQIARNPFGKVSKVTRKGIKADQKNFNWRNNLPLWLLLLVSVGGVGLPTLGASLGWWFLPPLEQRLPMLLAIAYNCVLMMMAILAAIDQPVRRSMDRFPLHTPCEVQVGDRTLPGITENLSEGGARVIIPNVEFPLDGDLTLILPSDRPSRRADTPISTESPALALPATLLRQHRYPQNQRCLALTFQPLDTQQQRQLVELLYCEMTWWKERKRPGGFDSLLALLVSLLQLRPITRRYQN
jgi:cellulose synthase (UDP-forming)